MPCRAAGAVPPARPASRRRSASRICSGSASARSRREGRAGPEGFEGVEDVMVVGSSPFVVVAAERGVFVVGAGALVAVAVRGVLEFAQDLLLHQERQGCDGAGDQDVAGVSVMANASLAREAMSMARMESPPSRK